MLLKTKFSYPVYFRKNSRCKKQWVHRETDEFEAVIKDVSKDECVLAGVLKSYDGKVKEYRHYQNTFWVVDDEAPQRLIRNASCLSVETARNEQEYNEGMASASICIDRDEKQERINDIQKEADDYICCDGHCWRKTGEPVFIFSAPSFYEEKPSCHVHFAPDNVGHNNMFNVKDMDWNKEDVIYLEKMEVLVPDVFRYGYDEEVLFASVKDSVNRFWPSSFNLGTMAPKLLDKVMPKIVEKVSKAHDLPYVFTDNEVYKAMSEALDELA